MEKFCNSISFGKDPTKSCCRIKIFSNQKHNKTNNTLALDNKTAKPTQTKKSFLPSLWKGTLGSSVTVSMTESSNS